MPRDVDILLPPRAVVARPRADIRGAGDTALLAVLGMFTMIDALLVVLWGLM